MSERFTQWPTIDAAVLRSVEPAIGAACGTAERATDHTTSVDSDSSTIESSESVSDGAAISCTVCAAIGAAVFAAQCRSVGAIKRRAVE